MVGRALVNSAPHDVALVTATRAELDLTSPDQVTHFFSRHQLDAVILAAAKVGGIENQTGFLLENLKIQNCVLEIASKLTVPNLIFLGSSCIYPRMAPSPIKESSLMTGPLEKTNEAYAIAKIAGIKLVNSIHEEFGLNYFSLMPTNLYGPNDNFDKKSSHVPAALMRRFHEAKILNRREVIVWGSGDPFREFMHVKDLARACWSFLNIEGVGGELINIGTGTDISIANFASLLAEIIGYKGKISYDTSKPDGTPKKLLDVSKAHSYGWRHEVELKTGLSETYDWFLSAFEKGDVRGF
jgi:GDP-L-fucose synthase